MPGKRLWVSKGLINQTQGKKSCLHHPLFLIWLFLTIKENRKVAVSVSGTEITVSVEIKSWHMEWVNPLEHNSQHRKYCLEIYFWAVSIKSLSIWPARASSGNGSKVEYRGHQISSHKLKKKAKLWIHLFLQSKRNTLFFLKTRGLFFSIAIFLLFVT